MAINPEITFMLGRNGTSNSSHRGLASGLDCRLIMNRTVFSAMAALPEPGMKPDSQFL
jgi:hypothetical protein